MFPVPSPSTGSSGFCLVLFQASFSRNPLGVCVIVLPDTDVSTTRKQPLPKFTLLACVGQVPSRSERKVMASQKSRHTTSRPTNEAHDRPRPDSTWARGAQAGANASLEPIRRREALDAEGPDFPCRCDLCVFHIQRSMDHEADDGGKNSDHQKKNKKT